MDLKRFAVMSFALHVFSPCTCCDVVVMLLLSAAILGKHLRISLLAPTFVGVRHSYPQIRKSKV